MGDPIGIGGIFEVPPSPEPIVQRFQVGDNVIAKWKGRERYLAHVTGYNEGKYSVYFLDNKIKDGLTDADLSEYDGVFPTRAQMIGQDFLDDGDDGFAAGRFRVRRVDGNTFVCIRLSGGGLAEQGQVCNFMIGPAIYAHEELKQQSLRKGVGEVGVGEVLDNRRRRQRR